MAAQTVQEEEKKIYYNADHNKYVNKYKKNKLHRININYSVDAANELKDFCKGKEIPVNTFIKQAIKEKLESEGVTYGD